jgi:hypothetical protein
MEDKLIVDGLKRRLIDITADIKGANTRIQILEHQKVTLLATLRLFEGRPDEENPTVTSVGFPVRAFSRTLLEVLRTAEDAMTPRELAIARIKTTGRQSIERAEMVVLLNRVRNTLHRLNAQVESETRHHTTYWKIAG